MTFTLKQSGLNLQVKNFCHDDDDQIYFLDDDGSDYHIYQLTASTNTKTKISENNSFDGDLSDQTNVGPLCFGGSVFIFTNDSAAEEAYIYKWVSGTTWTKQTTITYDSALSGGGGGRFAKVGSQLVAVFIASFSSDGSYTLAIRYSNDGSAWSTGTIDDGPSPPTATYNGIGTSVFGNGQTRPNGLWLRMQVTDGALPNHFNKVLFKWNGSNFDDTGYFYQKDSPDFTGDSWVEDLEFTDILNWYESFPYAYEEVTVTGDQTEANDTGIEPVSTVGFTTKSMGWDVDASQLLFFIMDPVGTWDSGEQIASLTNGFVTGVIRFTQTDDVWLFTSHGNIYQRDEGISDAALTVSAPTFYHDVNTLTERSTLPLASVPFRGMGVQKDTGLVVVPSAEAAAYMMAQGNIDDLYALWTDITYDIGQDSGLKVARWV